MDMNEDLIKLFLEKGYIEVAGYNPVGDPVYKITELFYKEQEELVEWMRKADSDTLNSLWFKGFVELRMDHDGMGYIYLTNKSDDWTDSDELTDDERSMMYLIYSTGAYYGGNN
jgi:hypothetical protein